MKAVACIVARTSSSRLPDKVLRDIGGRRMVEQIIDRVRMIPNLASIHLCTSTEAGDGRLREVAEANGIGFYAGSLEDPTERMVSVGRAEDADCVIRITGDNVFTDPVYLWEMLRRQEQDPVDYCRVDHLPLGITAEIMGREALEKCHASMDPEVSEYLMLYMFRPDLHRCRVLIPEPALQATGISLTVDTPADLERSQFICQRLGGAGPFSYLDILRLHGRETIPHIAFPAAGLIKLPKGQVVEYGEFRKDMETRCAQSERIQLAEGHYAAAWRELVSQARGGTR